MAACALCLKRHPHLDIVVAYRANGAPPRITDVTCVATEGSRVLDPDEYTVLYRSVPGGGDPK
jgi:hypothetical protein